MPTHDTPLYLVYDDVEPPQTPTRARWIRTLSDGERDDYWLVEIAPPIRVPSHALRPDIVPPPLADGRATTDGEAILFGQVVLRGRHRGYSLASIGEWPVYVHVAVPLVPTVADAGHFRTSDTFLVYWAALYTDEQRAIEAGRPWYEQLPTDYYLVLDGQPGPPVIRSCFRAVDRPWHAHGEHACFVPFNVHPPILDQPLHGSQLEWVYIARDDTRQPLSPIDASPIRVQVFHDIDIEKYRQREDGRAIYGSSYHLIGAGTLYGDREAALTSIE